ncbi:MAG: protein O-mannosyl-transferase family [Elusimicrobiota bacterium]
MNRWLAFFLLIIFFSFYTYQAAPSVTAGDSGEFITSAATLSLPHAPSFPVYTIISRAFLEIVPWGNIGYRCNIFSVLCGSLSLLLIFLLGIKLNLRFFTILLTVCCVGFSRSFWRHTLVTEVFALHALFFIGVLFLLIPLMWPGAKSENKIPTLILAAFLMMIGFGNHQIIVLLAPAWIYCFWFVMREEPLKLAPVIGALVLIGGIGFSTYLFLPLRSSKNPPLNWGKPTSITRFVRSLLRSDYGSLKLAIGETPPRNIQNSYRQIKQTLKSTHEEMGGVLLVSSFIVIGVGFLNKKLRIISGFLLILYFFTGPFFILLGNLPLTSQSAGILGRFYIPPVLALMLCFLMVDQYKWVSRILVFVFPVFLFQSNYLFAQPLRHFYMVNDYGNMMLRTIPPQGALYMDGGDDAFYSLAALSLAEGKRIDVELKDRGGLVFPNPYGDDFRSLTKEQKTDRRKLIEEKVLSRKPLFYSSMDQNVLPGYKVKLVGFLLKPEKETIFFKPEISWPLILIRNLYPFTDLDFRSRALACFFPYMQARQEFQEKDFDSAFVFYKKALEVGYDVEWLEKNLESDIANFSFYLLQNHRLEKAKEVYDFWITWKPTSYQAHSNLGVVFERMGKVDDAKGQYLKTSQLFLDSIDPLFNLSVLSWKEKDWDKVIYYLEQLLLRNPKHDQANYFLKLAQTKKALEQR